MSREWKPGDVAVDKDDDCRAMVVGAARSMGCPSHHPNAPHWHYAQSDWNPLNVQSVRPLVVIDPEDREQVERFAMTYANLTIGSVNWDKRDGMNRGVTVRGVQAALREFANPTPAKPAKPDEPQGLGAVVEDADGRLFIRYRSDVAKCQWTSTNFGVAAKWDEIDAVKVLSPGWSE